MQKTFSGEEFAEVLSSGTLQETVQLVGMAKKSDYDQDAILFAPGVSCLRWIPIPVSMIEQVDWFGKVACGDHMHDKVCMTLKECKGPEAAVLYSDSLPENARSPLKTIKSIGSSFGLIFVRRRKSSRRASRTTCRSKSAPLVPIG